LFSLLIYIETSEIKAEREGWWLVIGYWQRPKKPPPARSSVVFKGGGISDHTVPADIATLSVAGEEYLILYIWYALA
jgi:hypothetical protein